MSNVESTPSNENYSLILNFHNIYQKTSSPILFMFVGSIILLVTIRQFLTTEYLPIATTGTPMTLLLLTVLYTIPITLIVFSSLFGIRYLKKRKETKRGFVKVQSALVRRSYILNFELEESAGVSQKDKIFNHLSLVFPQINKIKKMRLKRGYTNIDQQSKWRITRWFIQNNKVNSFVFKKFDFAINTSTGVFVLKIVNDKILTFEDIENTVKDIRKKMTITGLGIEDKGVIDRLIFLTKSFDENISEQELDEKMKKLKKTCLIDIIKEEEYGYSTIWIN